VTPRTRLTRQALLDAAAELTYLRGITATGVDLIARRAGVTKRTLYQHFASKDELVAASLAGRDEVGLALLRGGAHARAERTGQLPALALFDVVERFLAGPGAAGCAFLNASLELGDRDHPAGRASRQHLAGREALVAELLRESGMDDPDLAAEVALLVDGAFAAGAARRDPTVAARAKHAAATLIEHRRAAPRG
jgi:AcrR family transcriptional regulator